MDIMSAKKKQQLGHDEEKKTEATKKKESKSETPLDIKNKQTHKHAVKI